MIGKILAGGFVCAGMAVGQTAAAPAAAGAAIAQAATTTTITATATIPTKAYAFDVISIRPNMTPIAADDGATSIRANGRWLPQPTVAACSRYLRLTSRRLVDAAFYNPQDQIKGIPDWLMSERYDVDARIADEDRAQWQKPGSQKAMLRAMLQAMLAERCKLTVHREVKETGVSSLVVAKGGPKFKVTDPTVEHPDGLKLPWGGTLVASTRMG